MEFRDVQVLTLFLSFFFVCYHGQTLPESLDPHHSACYGTHTTFRPKCQTYGTAIAVKDVYFGAKPTSSGCPDEVQDINNGTHVVFRQYGTTNEINIAECCEYDDADCIFKYDTAYVDGSSQDAYKNYHLCSGLNECSSASQVLWNTTSGRCDSSYPNQTNYMYMEYYCIDDTRTADMCGSVNKTVTGQPLYLQSPSYPQKIPAVHTSCNCSIQSSVCGDTINVYTVHVMMTSEGGACKQRINIKDLDDPVLAIEWNCDTQTDFNITTNTISAKYFLVNLENSLSTDDGYVWVGFQANSNAASLTVNCPPAEVTSCTVTTTGANGPSTGSGSEGGLPLYVIIGAAVGGILLIAIAILLYCCCCKKNKVQPGEDKENVDDDTEMDIESSGIYLLTSPNIIAKPSAAPANTRFYSPTPVPFHETTYSIEHSGSNQDHASAEGKQPRRLAPLVNPVFSPPVSQGNTSVPFHETRYIMEHSGTNQDSTVDAGKQPRRLSPLVHQVGPLSVANGGLGLASASLAGSLSGTKAGKTGKGVKDEGHKKKKKNKKKKHKSKSENDDKQTLKENEAKEHEDDNINIGEKDVNGDSFV